MEEWKNFKNCVDKYKIYDYFLYIACILDGNFMNSLEFNINRSSKSKISRRSIIYLGRCFFLLILASLFFLFSCEREDMFTISVNGPKYNIGDTGPGGGTVFYITDGGYHGMEVTKVNQTVSQKWSNIDNILANGATVLPSAFGTGLSNTDTIISQAGHTASAAKLCRDYNGGGKTDWFLPSRDELIAIWVNLVNDGFGANSGVGSFNVDYYWSSSESDAANAWYVSFNNGAQSFDVKSSTLWQVRAVRSF
jgi:hypothetical protein